MLSRIRTFLGLAPRASEEITDISDALSWIKTYRKAGDFDTATMAAKEIALKIQTSVTYYEKAEKKIAVLGNSNIEKIAIAAKEKRKKVNSILTDLYKQLRKIEKLSAEIEKEALDRKSLEERTMQKEKFKHQIREIDQILDKRDYSRALIFAKKLVSDFPQEKKVVHILAKTQKLYDRMKVKQRKTQAKEDQLKKMLREAGVETERTKERSIDSLFSRISLFIKRSRIKNLEKAEYIKRQKALKSIEQLLIRSGTITGIAEDSSNTELLSIMHSGLTKDIRDFSLHGFDFFGKIHGKDKIVGDTFGYCKEGNKTIFYIGDATGHGVQAGFTVALLSKLFFEFSRKMRVFPELFVTLNNELKQRIRGMVFVTSVFFEFDATSNKLLFIGA